MTIVELRAGLIKHDQGVLKHGSHHPEDKAFCALEFSSIMRGKELSDAPGDLPDLRLLNDAQWCSDRARTDALLPVLAALWDWKDWSEVKKAAWATHVSVEVVRQIIANLPGLSKDVVQTCRAVVDVRSAARAASLAYMECKGFSVVVHDAAEAAYNAASAIDVTNMVTCAYIAVRCAADATLGPESILTIACNICAYIPKVG